jgi:large subunit ribosomal protein L13Ae
MVDGTIVIDARGHLYGRLASIVAKQLLAGKKIAIVRCEQMVISGSIMRNKIKYAQFRQKRMNTNPNRGPFHFRSPARMFWRSVRGMVPHKTTRGANAMARLASFEGIPPAYQKTKRMAVPEAVKAIRLMPGRNFTVIGDLAREVGWGHQELVAKLESERQIKEQAYYAETKAKKIAYDKAAKSADLSAVNAVLSANGYA